MQDAIDLQSLLERAGRAVSIEALERWNVETRSRVAAWAMSEAARSEGASVMVPAEPSDVEGWPQTPIERTLEEQRVALRESLHRLARARQDHALKAAVLAGLREAFEDEHRGEILAMREARACLELRDAEVRESALRVYAGTQEKRPAPGVEIVDKTAVVYEDGPALAWALEHRVAVALDRKAFEAVARPLLGGESAGDLADVAALKSEPAVRIAAELDRVLAVAEEPVGEGRDA